MQTQKYLFSHASIVAPCYTFRMHSLHKRIDWVWKACITFLEKIVAGVVVIGVFLYAFHSTSVLVEMDWSQTETFFELIYRVLAVIIGLELVRMLVSHSISAVLELLAFVIARKMLKPDLASLDVTLGVLAFVALMAARHFFTESQFLHEKGDDHV